eukprot:Nk52_evm1s1378 gene=Nk52_evmTU1s1378
MHAQAAYLGADLGCLECGSKDHQIRFCTQLSHIGDPDKKREYCQKKVRMMIKNERELPRTQNTAQQPEKGTAMFAEPEGFRAELVTEDLDDNWRAEANGDPDILFPKSTQGNRKGSDGNSISPPPQWEGIELRDQCRRAMIFNRALNRTLGTLGRGVTQAAYCKHNDLTREEAAAWAARVFPLLPQ